MRLTVVRTVSPMSIDRGLSVAYPTHSSSVKVSIKVLSRCTSERATLSADFTIPSGRPAADPSAIPM